MKPMPRILCACMVVVFIFGAFCLSAQAVQDEKKQVPQQKPANITTRIYHVRNAEPVDIANALRAAVQSGQLALTPSSEFRTLTLTGTPQALDGVEPLIRELDVARVPVKSIEIVGYLLGATDAAAGDQKTPAVLDPVVKQLRSTLQYTSYQLLDTVLLRTRSNTTGSARGEISLPGTAPGESFSYVLYLRIGELSKDAKGYLIHMSDLSIEVSPRVGRLLSTTVDLREGQTTVVGKGGLAPGAKALILVLNAKVLD